MSVRLHNYAEVHSYLEKEHPDRLRALTPRHINAPAPYWPQKVCPGHQRVKPNELIFPDIATPGYRTNFPDDIVSLFFESSHESDPFLGPAAKELVLGAS
jgi:hypothetical protein